jgi:signal transduction histidine kinase
VIMMLTFAEDEVALTIRDDGRGFTPANVNIDSLGLTIMRERAAKVQADLQIESEVGVGTAVSVRVGLAQRA